MKARYHFIFFICTIIFVISLFFSTELSFLISLRHFLFYTIKIDTFGHFISFFLLTWVLHSLLKFHLPTLIFTLIIYGGLTELGQLYLGFRNAEFNDFLADISGVLFFTLLKFSYIKLNILFLKYKAS